MLSAPLSGPRASARSFLCWPRMRPLPEEPTASTRLAPTHRGGLEDSPLTPSTHLGALKTLGQTSLCILAHSRPSAYSGYHSFLPGQHRYDHGRREDKGQAGPTQLGVQCR